jgi:hypothetical protein
LDAGDVEAGGLEFDDAQLAVERALTVGGAFFSEVFITVTGRFSQLTGQIESLAPSGVF